MGLASNLNLDTTGCIYKAMQENHVVPEGWEGNSVDDYFLKTLDECRAACHKTSACGSFKFCLNSFGSFVIQACNLKTEVFKDGIDFKDLKYAHGCATYFLYCRSGK